MTRTGNDTAFRRISSHLATLHVISSIVIIAWNLARVCNTRIPAAVVSAVVEKLRHFYLLILFICQLKFYLGIAQKTGNYEGGTTHLYASHSFRDTSYNLMQMTKARQS